ncbi:MAG: 30S ribosomal protein S9 [Candidatus Omnitrophota bacterium]
MVEIVKFSATGRRKTAVARVNLSPGSGKIVVNEFAIEKYFTRETDRILLMEPLRCTNSIAKFDIIAKVFGGGITGQAGAMKLAISRALAVCDEENRKALKKENCLSRDPRMKERKKPGQKGARRKFQWVKR